MQHFIGVIQVKCCYFIDALDSSKKRCSMNEQGFCRGRGALVIAQEAYKCRGVRGAILLVVPDQVQQSGVAQLALFKGSRAVAE